MSSGDILFLQQEICSNLYIIVEGALERFVSYVRFGRWPIFTLFGISGISMCAMYFNTLTLIHNTKEGETHLLDCILQGCIAGVHASGIVTKGATQCDVYPVTCVAVVWSELYAIGRVPLMEALKTCERGLEDFQTRVVSLNEKVAVLSTEQQYVYTYIYTHIQFMAVSDSLTFLKYLSSLAISSQIAKKVESITAYHEKKVSFNHNT